MLSIFYYFSSVVLVEPDAITTLANFCDGDARSALNGLQLAVQAKRARFLQEGNSTAGVCNQTKMETTNSSSMLRHAGSEKDTSSPREMPRQTSLDEAQPSDPTLVDERLFPIVTVEDAKESLQRTHLLYDRAGEEHYNSISALHKSMRGSDANAALYWLARMLCAGEDPLYVARRVVRFASEDIGKLPL